MKIAFVGSECYPFVKTGGLGDVMYALPRALIRDGCEVRVILPLYQCIPDRMASRILGMGDVLSLIEKAEAAYDAKTAAEMEKKLREQTFTLEDFLVQLRQLKKMGNLEQILGMMPGVNASALKDANIDEKQTAKTEAIVLSMTKEERMDPSVIGGSRRRRIAKGSGTTVEDVNRLLKQFDQMKKLMKQFSGTRGMRLPGMGRFGV